MTEPGDDVNPRQIAETQGLSVAVQAETPQGADDGRVPKLEAQIAQVVRTCAAGIRRKNPKEDRDCRAARAELAVVQANYSAAGVTLPGSPPPRPVATAAANGTTRRAFRTLQSTPPGPGGRNMPGDISSGLFVKEGSSSRMTPRAAGAVTGEEDVWWMWSLSAGATTGSTTGSTTDTTTASTADSASSSTSSSASTSSSGSSVRVDTCSDSEAERGFKELKVQLKKGLKEQHRRGERARPLAEPSAPAARSAVRPQPRAKGTEAPRARVHPGGRQAACVLFRHCIRSGAFHAEATPVFDRIISEIGEQVKKGWADNNRLAYWLTNAVSLLHMLEKNVKKPRGEVTAGSSTGGTASVHGEGDVGGFKQVEAKYPALLFKQQLDAFVQKIFCMIRDNVQKEISPMLNNCILMPKASGLAPPRPGTMAPHDKPAGAGGAAPHEQQVAARESWTDILHVLDTLLAVVKANHVPKVVAQALFKQLFRFINVQLFNDLLMRRECCSASNGEHVAAGLEQVAHWVNRAGADYIADSWEELKHIRQAAAVLALPDKASRSFEDITSDLCPALTVQQIYRIHVLHCLMSDTAMTDPEMMMSLELLRRLRQAIEDSDSGTSAGGFQSRADFRYLLDDASVGLCSLPFKMAEELLHAMDDDEEDLYGGVTVPEAPQDGGDRGDPPLASRQKELRAAAPAAVTC